MTLMMFVAAFFVAAFFVAGFFVAGRQSASRQVASQQNPGDESSVSEATCHTGNDVSIAMLPDVAFLNETSPSRSANSNREAASMPTSRSASVAPIATGATLAWTTYVVIGYLIGVGGFALR